MAENLAYMPYVMPKANPEGIWISGFDGIDTRTAQYHGYYKQYGCLYSWSVALTVCPDGWHLPSDDEWTELEQSLEGAELISSTEERKHSERAGAAMKSPEGWPTEFDNSTDCGFKALPAGMRYFSGHFHHIGDIAYFWTSTEAYAESAWYRCVMDTSNATFRGFPDKRNGFSVRCVRD